MSVEYFENDEPGYADWLSANPRGYVVNFDLSGNAGTRLHRVRCVTLEPGSGGGGLRTVAYAKACARERSELDDWHIEKRGRGLRRLRCSRCEPPSLGLT